MTSPAGWYPDPSGGTGQRYFDGARWTAHQTPPAQPAQPPALSAPAGTKRTNIIGIIALVASIIGFIFACIPDAPVVGWVLLPTAFVLGIAGLFLTGMTRGASIAAAVVSIIGTVVGVAVFFTQAGASDGYQVGSRQNPVPFGAPSSNRDWDITLGHPREAWSEISAVNPVHTPPQSGMEYWIVPISATYKGDRTGNTSYGVGVTFVGSDNRTYDYHCGILNAFENVGDLHTGGQAAGDVCLVVPAGADGLWSVSSGFGPVFFGAK